MSDPYIFISHAKADTHPVGIIADALRGAGYGVWIDDVDVPDGSTWSREIEMAVQNCGAMVIIMTRQSRDREWVEREALLALELRKPIFIALFEDVTLPIHLINRQFTDFRTRPDQGMKRLIAALAKVSLTQPLPEPKGESAIAKHSAAPNEHNIFRYIEQLPDGETCARIARELHAWASTNADDVSYTGRAAPAFHANVYVGPGGATVFSVRASRRQPTVEVPLSRLAEFAPFDKPDQRRRVLTALNRLMPDGEQLEPDRADKLPNLPLARALGSAAGLDEFKRMIGDLIRDLRANNL